MQVKGRAMTRSTRLVLYGTVVLWCMALALLLGGGGPLSVTAVTGFACWCTYLYFDNRRMDREEAERDGR